MRQLGAFLAFCLLSFSAPAQAVIFSPASTTLDNGLQLIIVPNHLAPAVTQMVWYRVGSNDETPGKTGLAHYLEHLMFRGTNDMPPGEFSRRIAAQGGNDNAFTSHDYTAYFETVAADRLPMIMQMEADRMQNLHITPEIAGPELHVVMNERDERTDNDPQGRFQEKLNAMLMPDHPQGRPIIGWRKEIEKLTAADAMQFYQAHYAPNNAIVIISGDVEPEAVFKLAQSIYGPVPKRAIAARKPLPPPPLPDTRRFVMKDGGVEQPQLQRVYVVPSYATQKAHEAYAIEVLAEALDGGEVGLLYRNLVMKQGIASTINTRYDGDARGDTLFTIATTPSPGKTPEQLEKALDMALQDLAQQGIDAKTISDAKRRLQRAAIFARDSLMMPGYVFGMALTTGHTIADAEAWPERIAAVTADEVNTALKNLAAEARSITGLLLPDPHAKRKPRPTKPAGDREIR